MKIDCEKLLMKADHLEHINNTHHTDKKAMNDAVAKCLIRTEQLGLQTEETLRKGNFDLKRETELKMCRFTENLMLEFKYLNKRLEDKILFQVGYYQEMPEDTRGPRECWLRLDKDIKDKVRPVSAVNHKLDFDLAL
jgi:hypothetical protein